MNKKEFINLLTEKSDSEGIIGLIKFVIHYLFTSFISRTQFMFLPLVVRDIKHSEKNRRISEVITYVFDGFGRLAIKPWQIRSEITELLRIIEAITPRAIMEIGTANGGTLFLLTRMASEQAKLISIDLPDGKFGGGYTKRRGEYYKSFALPDQQIQLLRKDSHKESTLEEVKKILDGEQLDFLFIDGDHTYTGVKQDFEMYSLLVKKGGIIAFHDIAPQAPETGCEVKRFWDEIKGEYDTLDLLDQEDQWGFGIGVIRL